MRTDDPTQHAGPDSPTRNSFPTGDDCECATQGKFLGRLDTFIPLSAAGAGIGEAWSTERDIARLSAIS
jgi:hypothetical protein